MARRRIYSQGAFDGACFLYALANAYTALTGTTVTMTLWHRAIRGMPYLTDFLSGTVGTDRYRGDPQVLRFAMERMLAALGGPSRFRVEHTDCTTPDEIAGLIDRRSVAFLCINRTGGSRPFLDHWVCGVGRGEHPASVRLACSWKYQRNHEDYRERLDPEFGRYYNDRFRQEDAARVIPGTVYRVALQRARTRSRRSRPSGR
ncbi:hypothetical protein SVA_2163 [Sulfurifustis variabilis]|uniref:Uncharacterized protein n=1 Tax=Sulfurifustis variabilis TaxID=1675686 RepID=A0A1B4V5A0_9GAMM|nr:hypothetical protein [Sulfurifustis variabilis]BAU48713.1 hypothetical protein SVA_2163 [Sulfurifustis variabilis]